MHVKELDLETLFVTRERIRKALLDIATRSNFKYIANPKVSDRLLILADLVDILHIDMGPVKRGINIDVEKRRGCVFADMTFITFEDGCTHYFFQYSRLADRVVMRQVKKGFIRLEFFVEGLFFPLEGEAMDDEDFDD